MHKSRSAFQHDEISKPLTLAQQTEIRMPMQDEETIYAALFVLENNVPLNVSCLSAPSEAGGFILRLKLLDDQRIAGTSVRKYHIHNIWAADTNSLEDLTEEDEEATVPPIEESWQSPFAGQSVKNAFEPLALVPLDKSLNRTFIIVLNQALYEQKKWVVIYRIDEGGEITSILCVAHMCMTFIDSETEHHWPEYLEEWRRYGKPIF